MALKSIDHSLVLNGFLGTQHLSATLGAPTDATRWTFSTWFKRGRIEHGQESGILSGSVDADNRSTITFTGNGDLLYKHRLAGSQIDQVTTNASFRDPTAWYHLVVQYNSNEAVDVDRIKFFVNNVQATSLQLTNMPVQFAASFINGANNHEIGDSADEGNRSYDGYLADSYFCDGQILAPTVFAEQVDDTWQPISASPTFGNNGFLLEYGDDLELGDDTSGNVNDFTENAITAANQRDDTPSHNVATFNPTYFSTAGTLDAQVRNGGLLWATGQFVAPGDVCFATTLLPKSDKYYWEIEIVTAGSVNQAFIGVADNLADVSSTDIGGGEHAWLFVNDVGTTLSLRHAGSNTAFTSTGTLQTGDYAMVAYDATNGKLWFGVNGTWVDSGDPANGLNPVVTINDAFNMDLIPVVSLAGTNNVLAFRGSPEDQATIAPSGFVTLDVREWSDPPIPKPSDFFDLTIHVADDATSRAITGLDFQPDLGMIKGVDAAKITEWVMTDITKGPGVSHTNNVGTADEAANVEGEISAFNSDGFTVIQNTTVRDVNESGTDYIGFMWKEDVLAGLDLVGYVGAAAPQNIAHGLGVPPKLMYVRNRDTAAGNAIYSAVRHVGGIPTTDPETDFLESDATPAIADSPAYWDDTAPDASNFRVGSDTAVNANTDNHQAYVWAEVEGFSKFTAYIGSNVEDSPQNVFVYLGFRPKFVIIKRLDAAQDWAAAILATDIGDNDNDDANERQAGTDSSNIWRWNLEFGTQNEFIQPMDFCATGVKIVSAGPRTNALGDFLIFAWAAVPFKLASARAAAAPGPAAGAVDLAIDITATGDLPNQHGDGALDLGIQIDATGDLPVQHGAGALDIGIVIDGQGTNINRHGDGALDLLLDVTATADYPGEFGDSVNDLAIQVDGAGVNNAKHGDGQLFMVFDHITAAESGDDGGSAPLPVLQTNGVIVSSFPLIGSARIPQLQVVATIDNSSVISGNVRLPQLQTQGEIDGDMDVDLPLLQVEGVMVPGRVYFTDSLGLRIPVLQVVGAGVSQQLSGGSIILPKLRVQGSILPGSVITENPDAGGLVLPQLQVEGFLFVPNEGTGSVLLPALDIDPLSFIAAGSIGGGSVTLPFVQVEGIIVNGVALTGTVWVMNTETFETTNYLNFDFDSLVSFNEQPYGVTSSGIFLLEGDDDDGTDINARILTGISDRGDENLSEVAQLYLQYEGQSVILQLLPDGQQKIREYEIVRRSNSSGLIHARAKGSRGLRSRSWQMGFRNLSGGDFTFDKMGLLIRQLTRKTRKN